MAYIDLETALELLNDFIWLRLSYTHTSTCIVKHTLPFHSNFAVENSGGGGSNCDSDNRHVITVGYKNAPDEVNPDDHIFSKYYETITEITVTFHDERRRMCITIDFSDGSLLCLRGAREAEFLSMPYDT